MGTCNVAAKGSSAAHAPQPRDPAAPGPAAPVCPVAAGESPRAPTKKDINFPKVPFLQAKITQNAGSGSGSGIGGVEKRVGGQLNGSGASGAFCQTKHYTP